MSRTIAEAMQASKTARPAIDKARAILNLRRDPRTLSDRRAKAAKRYQEFNTQCRGLA